MSEWTFNDDRFGPPERVIAAADGKVARVGDRVWNFYDLRWVTIAEEPDADGWFSTTEEDGSRGPVLNGERITTTEVRPA